MGDKNRARFIGISVSLVIILLGSLFANRYTIAFNEQDSKSIPGTMWLVDKKNQSVTINSVIQFKPPVLPKPFHAYSGDDVLFIKFVKGMAGDVIKIDDNNVFINNELLTTISDEVVDKLDLVVNNQEYTLKEDEFFVYGDHRRSYDSRYFGPVTINEIKGVANEIF